MAIANYFSKGQALALFQGKNADLTAIAALSPSDGQFLARRSGAWAADGILSADLTTALASPPAIGGAAAANGTFLALVATGATFNGSIQVSDGSLVRVRGSDANFYISKASGLDYTRVNGFAGVVLSSFANAQIALFANAATTLRAVDTATNSVTNALILQHNGGTVVAGFGTGVLFQAEGSTTENRSVALIEALWNVPTNAAAIGDLVGSAYYNAAGTLTKREGWRIRGGASETLMSVYGAAPVARAAHIADPSGGGTQDAEARTAVNAILVALENFGILLAS